MHKKILVDARWTGSHGIGRFADEIIGRLGTWFPNYEKITAGLPLLNPIEPAWLASITYIKKPSVYFSPGFNPPLFCKCPFIFTIHDLIHIDVIEESTRLKRLFYSNVVRPATKRAFKVLTDSNYSKARILEWTNISEESVTVVGCGVNDIFFTETTPYLPGFPYLLYVGNQKPHKNLPRLIQAFSHSGLYSDFRLLISGDPNNTLIKEAAKFNIENKVIFTGFIPDAEMPSYYRGAHAFLYPSLYEGFGLPPIEAMAAGTPVLTSDATCLPEVVGDAALTVDASDIDALSENLARICYDASLRDQLAKRGRLHARSYSWDKTARLVYESLSDALAANGAPLC